MKYFHFFLYKEPAILFYVMVPFLFFPLAFPKGKLVWCEFHFFFLLENKYEVTEREYKTMFCLLMFAQKKPIPKERVLLNQISRLSNVKSPVFTSEVILVNISMWFIFVISVFTKH